MYFFLFYVCDNWKHSSVSIGILHKTDMILFESHFIKKSSFLSEQQTFIEILEMQ